MRIAPYEFEAFDFTHESKTCKVLRIGKGPGVVVMHEIFGLTKKVGRLAGLISEAGFTTYIPVLFGNADKPAFTKIDRYCNLVQIPLCLRKEFYLLATHQSSPITTWLRALCHQVHQACGGPGVGAIGMCLTGGFALSLMLDKFLLAPVMSQPSLPISCCSKRRKSALGLSDDELAIVKERVDSAKAAGASRHNQRFGVRGMRVRRGVGADRLSTANREAPGDERNKLPFLQ